MGNAPKVPADCGQPVFVKKKKTPEKEMTMTTGVLAGDGAGRAHPANTFSYLDRYGFRDVTGEDSGGHA